MFMNHDVNPCATPGQKAETLRCGGLWPASAPAPVAARLALDEYFHWHRIRRLPRK